MSLVQGKCPNCGGILPIDDSMDACICQFCNTPIINEKAINNYNYSITNNVMAENVQVYGGKDSMEELLQKEKAFLQVGDSNRLHSVYSQMIDNYPTRYEGWWGMIKLRTNSFSSLQLVDFNELDKWMGMCRSYAPQNVFPTLNAQYTDYINKVLAYQKSDKIKNLETSLASSITNDQNNKSSNLHNLERRKNDLNSQITKIGKPILIKRVIVIVIMAFLISPSLMVITEYFQGEGGWPLLFVIIAFVALLVCVFLFKNAFISSNTKELKKQLADVERQIAELNNQGESDQTKQLRQQLEELKRQQ